MTPAIAANVALPSRSESKAGILGIIRWRFREGRGGSVQWDNDLNATTIATKKNEPKIKQPIRANRTFRPSLVKARPTGDWRGTHCQPFHHQPPERGTFGSLRTRKFARRVQDRLQELVQAGVGELRLGFDTGDGQRSIRTAAGVGDECIQEGCLADARVAGHDQRSTVLSSCRQGSHQLT
jgi:hypothetical protein